MGGIRPSLSPVNMWRYELLIIIIIMESKLYAMFTGEEPSPYIARIPEVYGKHIWLHWYYRR